MQLENANLRSFVGGQIEIQNRPERYLMRGEIKSIRIEGEGDDAMLVVELNWMAKDEGYLSSRTGLWTKSSNATYTLNLMTYGTTRLGDGKISLIPSVMNEVVVLFPKGSKKNIRRSDVVGL